MLQDLPDNHDLNHLKNALGFVKSFRTAVDGGAHRGIWTRFLCSKFKSVYAFEPVPDLAVRIPCGKVFPIALGEKSGICAMEPGLENTGQGHIISGNSSPIRSLDSFALLDVDFLKLDVEGYEYNALLGGIETIQFYRPIIMIEENGLCKRYGFEPGDAGRLLISWGYEEVAKYNKDYVYRFGQTGQ